VRRPSPFVRLRLRLRLHRRRGLRLKREWSQRFQEGRGDGATAARHPAVRRRPERRLGRPREGAVRPDSPALGSFTRCTGANGSAGSTAGARCSSRSTGSDSSPGKPPAFSYSVSPASIARALRPSSSSRTSRSARAPERRSSASGSASPPRWGRWLGLYANWQGIGAQLAALAAVYGSYALARGLQKHRRRRAISGSALAAEPQTISER